MNEILRSVNQPYDNSEVQRYDIINYLINYYGFEDYLEIGVCNPKECFDKIICENKDGVDPGIEFPLNPVKYRMTSDEFFNSISITKKWDIIFIDGLHTSNQVLCDIENSLKHLKNDGFVILHDVNPPNIWMQRENYSIDGINHPWNGTVWKAFYYLRAKRNDLAMCCIDADWGVGIIRRGRQTCTKFDNPFFEYNLFKEKRKEHLNLISFDQLDRFLIDTENQ